MKQDTILNGTSNNFYLSSHFRKGDLNSVSIKSMAFHIGHLSSSIGRMVTRNPRIITYKLLYNSIEYHISSEVL